MAAITYTNTKTTIPGLVNNVHVTHPRGYAYETSTHFVHLYGYATRYNAIHIGLTAIQEKTGSLKDWVTDVFGAQNIEPLDLEVGHSVRGVWRPSLYFYEDTFQALGVTEIEMRLSESSLRTLMEKLDVIFQYIEPDSTSLSTYSHKTRELLILACTEVENFWKYYMVISGHTPSNGRTFTTNDYVKICRKLHLAEYEFILKTYSSIPAIRPFATWVDSAPTTSLRWYDAYNKTKHDRESHFPEASLINCINAVVATLVMHCIKFGPFPMIEQSNIFSSLVNQHFEGSLVNSNPKTYYLQEVQLPADTRKDLFIFNPRQENYCSPFIVDHLIL